MKSMISSRSNKAQGWVLVAALVLALILAMVVIGVITYTTSSLSLARARGSAEAAYLLADGGVSDEMNYVTNHMYDPTITNRSSQPVLWPGQPYMGRPGSIPNVNGSFWVYSSALTSDPVNNPSPWPGFGKMQIVSHALVNGAIRTVVITSQPYSVFDIFGFFAINSTDRTNPSVSMSGNNTVVTVNGTVGTNGRVQRGNATIVYTSALNANTAAWGTNDQFGTGVVFSQPNPKTFPTVTQTLKNVFPATASLSDSAAWTYLQNSIVNNSAIRMWKSGLSSGAAMTPSNTVSAGFTNTLVSFTNKQGNTKGAWQGVNNKPGSTTVSTLILPPGDYYFNSINLLYDPTTELVIDNAGLSVGGNPNNYPVRIWMSTGGTSNDNISLPFTLTNANDVSTFRLFYNKDGCTFQFSHDSGMPGNMVVNGGLYAVSGGTKGTNVNFTGLTNASQQVVINGSLIADRLDFSGYCTINFPGSSIENPYDPAGGVAFLGGYYEN